MPKDVNQGARPDVISPKPVSGQRPCRRTILIFGYDEGQTSHLDGSPIVRSLKHEWHERQDICSIDRRPISARSVQRLKTTKPSAGIVISAEVGISSHGCPLAKMLPPFPVVL